MTGISLITASYARDLESCRLLCDSIDAYVTGYARHYIVVPPSEMHLFAPLAGPRREIVDARRLVRAGVRPLPFKWRGRKYYWAPWLLFPVYGWHLQQLRKIAMTLMQPEDRVIHVDSDNCFVRPFDASALAAGSVPLQVVPGAVDGSHPLHRRWWRNAYRLLGLTAPKLPGDDYIGQIVVWEKASVSAMTARVERASGGPWPQALCRMRHFSEYMLYGVAVVTDPALMARHAPVQDSTCLGYWSGPALNAATLLAFVSGLAPNQRAIAVQSFTHTSIDLIRAYALPKAPVE